MHPSPLPPSRNPEFLPPGQFVCFLCRRTLPSPEQSGRWRKNQWLCVRCSLTEEGAKNSYPQGNCCLTEEGVEKLAHCELVSAGGTAEKIAKQLPHGEGVTGGQLMIDPENPIRDPERYTEAVLANFANEGGGVNPRLVPLAAGLLRAHDPAEVFARMRCFLDRIVEHRRIEDREIWKAIEKGGGSPPPAWTPPPIITPTGETLRHRKWPARNDEAIAAAVHNRPPQMAILEYGCPGLPPTGDSRAERALDLLFPGNPRLCLGKDKEQAVNRPREAFRGREHRAQFIVPFEMLAEEGLTKEGRVSPRALCITSERGYTVVEADFSPEDCHRLTPADWPTYDLCLAVIARLREEGAPLVCVVWSGNVSLHGHFNLTGWSAEDVYEFQRLAVALGADPATFTRNQWVRMPHGLRDGKMEQSIIFFDESQSLTKP